jgi:hypothetical protein
MRESAFNVATLVFLFILFIFGEDQVAFRFRIYHHSAILARAALRKLDSIPSFFVSHIPRMPMFPPRKNRIIPPNLSFIRVAWI